MFYDNAIWQQQIRLCADHLAAVNPFTNIPLTADDVYNIFLKYFETCVKLGQKSGVDVYYQGYNYNVDALFGASVTIKIVYMAMKNITNESDIQKNIDSFDTTLRDKIWAVEGRLYYHAAMNNDGYTAIFKQLLYPCQTDRNGENPAAIIGDKSSGQSAAAPSGGISPMIILAAGAAALFLLMGKKGKK